MKVSLHSWVPDLPTTNFWDFIPVIGFTFLFLYSFYMIYILVMGVYRAQLQKKLSMASFVLCSPWILIGYTLDVLGNILIASILFLELPKEWLVTTRLIRYLKVPESERGWRYSVSKWICENLLDVFDPTDTHCV